MTAEIFSKEKERLQLHAENVLLQEEIAKRKLAEEKVKNLELGINNITDYAIFLLDTEGRIKTWNKGAEHIKGYKAEEIIGQSFTKFYREEDIINHYPEKILTMANQQGHFEKQGWRVRKDGSSFWANVVITPIYDEKEEHIGFMKITRDLTELKLAEEKIKKLKQARSDALREDYEKQLKLKDKLLQDKVHIVAEVCHEVRNPLQGIYGNIEIVHDAIDQLNMSDPMFNDKITNISKSLDKMRLCADYQKIILDNFIDMASLQSGKLKLIERSFDIVQVISAAISMLQSRAERKGLKLLTQIPPINKHWVMGDDVKLIQIAINLLSNAIKFTQKGSVILSLKVMGETAEHIDFSLAVKDTGMGMTYEEKNRLFQPFSRIAESLSPSIESTGLGLYVTKKILELMGGSIEINSEKNKGTTFTCVMHYKPTAPDNYLCQQAQIPRASHSRTVLIVDDNPISRKVLKNHLQGAGCVCITKNNGREAITCIKEQSFDIIFMDIKMLPIDGITATKKIRELEKECQLPHTPIIGISGSSQPLDQENAMQAGMNAYLVKPFMKENIYKILEQYALGAIQNISKPTEEQTPTAKIK